MEGWWRDGNAMGSLEYDDEILDNVNLALVNYIITHPIIVVTGFIASK